MQYPYRVSADETDISPTTTYHRTPESAEGAVVKLLRAGRPVVRVTYRRRPLLTFTTGGPVMTDHGTGSAGEPLIRYPEWFLLTGCEALEARAAAWVAMGSPKSPNGDPMMPMNASPSTHIRAAVGALGDVVTLPRGQVKRNAVSRLIERHGMTQAEAVAVVETLKEHIR